MENGFSLPLPSTRQFLYWAQQFFRCPISSLSQSNSYFNNCSSTSIFCPIIASAAGLYDAVAWGLGVFPSAGVREYACSGLYLVVDPGAGTAQSHIHRSLHYVDHEVAKTNSSAIFEILSAKTRLKSCIGRQTKSKHSWRTRP